MFYRDVKRNVNKAYKKKVEDKEFKSLIKRTSVCSKYLKKVSFLINIIKVNFCKILEYIKKLVLQKKENSIKCFRCIQKNCNLDK